MYSHHPLLLFLFAMCLILVIPQASGQSNYPMQDQDFFNKVSSIEFPKNFCVQYPIVDKSLLLPHNLPLGHNYPSGNETLQIQYHDDYLISSFSEKITLKRVWVLTSSENPIFKHEHNQFITFSLQHPNKSGYVLNSPHSDILNQVNNSHLSVKVMPNPFKDFFTLQITSLTSQPVQATIKDIYSRTIGNYNLFCNEGNNEFQINLMGKTLSGTYIVVVNDNHGNSVSQKIVSVPN